jgi:hypothetical protein
MPDRMAIIVEDGVKIDNNIINKREFFWDDVVDYFNKEFLINIGCFDIIGPENLRNMHNYDILIINWDAANGDQKFGSDRLLNEIQNNKPKLKDFVKDGGILIVECQSNNWLPSQSAYDAILNSMGSVRVTDEEPSRVGFFVRRVNLPHIEILGGDYFADNDHPILKKLPEKIYPLLIFNEGKSYNSWYKDRWFNPRNSVNSNVLCKTYPNKVYVGWFSSYSKEWKPLLYDEDNKHPVMIWRPYDKGAVIISTMFLASSFIPQLILNIFSKDFKNQMQNYVLSVNAKSKERKTLVYGIVGTIIVTIVGVIMTIYFFGGFIQNMIIGMGVILTTIITAFLVRIAISKRTI